MEKNCRFSYNEIDDSLILSLKEENEIVKENFMFDDLIFSLTGRGKIIGIQIRNFSRFLEESGSKVDLNNLKDIKLNIIPKENNLFIGIMISTKKQEEIKFPLGRIFMPNITA